MITMLRIFQCARLSSTARAEILNTAFIRRHKKDWGK
jgi:hypothetical protein